MRKARYIVLTAAILLLVSYFCTFVSLEMRHSVVILTGIMGAVLLGHFGHNTTLSALYATMYVVVGTQLYPENSKPLFSGFLTFIESFFFFVMLVETGMRIKPYLDANRAHIVTLKMLFIASVCCLLACIYLDVVHIEIRTACLLLVGGFVSVILGTIEQNSAYSAFAVAAYVTLGCILAQSVSGVWTKPGELNSEIIVVFSASFFVSSLLMHVSEVLKAIRSKKNISDSEHFFGGSNTDDCCSCQRRIKYPLRSVALVLVAILCGIFLFIESRYAQIGYIVILGGAGSVVLGSMKNNKFSSAIFIAFYIALGISIAMNITHNFNLEYDLYKITSIFVESFFASTIFIYITSILKVEYKNYNLTTASALKMMFGIFAVLIIILCALIMVEIKIREIFFLALCGVFAVAIGYIKCNEIAISSMLSAYITVGLLLPRYISSRLSAKGEFDLAAVRIFLLAFCFSLFMITVGGMLKRLVFSRKSVTRMSQP